MLLLAGVMALGFIPPEAAPSPTSTGEMSARVTIISVSEEPTVLTGFVATFVRVTGRAEGVNRDYLIPFARPGQPQPRIGATCIIVFRRFDFRGHVGPLQESVDGGDGVVRYRCDDDSAVFTGF